MVSTGRHRTPGIAGAQEGFGEGETMDRSHHGDRPHAAPLHPRADGARVEGASPHAAPHAGSEEQAVEDGHRAHGQPPIHRSDLADPRDMDH